MSRYNDSKIFLDIWCHILTLHTDDIVTRKVYVVNMDTQLQLLN
jgi:hypothetical protein